MKGTFRIETFDNKFYAIWGIGPLYLVGSPGGKITKARLCKCKRGLENEYQTFTKMSYETAVAKLQEKLREL